MHQGDDTIINKRIYPKEGNYDKTKWKTILAVEPKAFFDKYLSQYPGDTHAVQPVVVFSHKPLETFAEISEVCKVMDIAVSICLLMFTQICASAFLLYVNLSFPSIFLMFF